MMVMAKRTSDVEKPSDIAAKNAIAPSLHKIEEVAKDQQIFGCVAFWQQSSRTTKVVAGSSGKAEADWAMSFNTRDHGSWLI